MPKKPERDQLVVYLEPRDRKVLEELARKTGVSRSELLRRGLWQLADSLLHKGAAGSAFGYLVETAGTGDAPADLSSRPDHYLYGGGYASWSRGKSRVSERGPKGEEPRRKGRAAKKGARVR